MKRSLFILSFLFIVNAGISQPGGGNGGPCDSPNPPTWCNNKGCYPPPCIPVGGPVATSLLIVGGVWLVYRIQGRDTIKK